MNSQGRQLYVIVHALLWVDAYAIESLYRLISPKTQVVACFTPDELAEALVFYDHASVVLGVCPHESIFLLSRVAPYLQQRRVLFFARQFNYVDQQVPFYFLAAGVEFYAWKNKNKNEAQIALLDFIHLKKNSDIPQEFISPPSMFSRADELISDVNRYLYLKLPLYGVREQSRKTLAMLAWGWSTVKIAKTLGINIKTVSSHKLFGLASLEMGIGSCDIYRGIVAKEILQRYAFWDVVEKGDVSRYEDIRDSSSGERIVFATRVPVSPLQEVITLPMMK